MVIKENSDFKWLTGKLVERIVICLHWV